LRGTAFGLYNVVKGTSFFVSNVVFGFLWDNYNLITAALYSIILSTAAIIGMFVFVRRFSIKKSIVIACCCCDYYYSPLVFSFFFC
jgi:predicted MFS family arabinose efflux permease